MTTEQVKVQGLLTVAECAELLQCSYSTVAEWIRKGELRRVNLSSREVGASSRGPKGWRVRPAALDEFIKSREGTEVSRAPAATEAPVRPKLPVGRGNDGKSRMRLSRERSGG